MHVGLHASPRCLPRLGDAIASNGIEQPAAAAERLGRRRARSPTAPTSPRTLPSTSALCSPEVGNQRSDAAFAAHVGVWHCTPYVTGREGAAREGAHGRRDRRRVQGLAGEGYPALSGGLQVLLLRGS